ncbi:MAG TPA: hypothetical protein VG709_01140 [Actinomycetota bacterium]|nr:hypothetical protein [Actinomycetota bacterium]
MSSARFSRIGYGGTERSARGQDSSATPARAAPRPRRRPMRPRMIFLHIPKTGGATLRSILLRQFPARAIHVQQHRPQMAGPATDGSRPLAPPPVPAPDARARTQFRAFEAMTEAQRARVLLVVGHYVYGVHEAFPGPSTYVTILRDPVERALSLFHYRRTAQGLWMGLEEYLASGVDPELENGQTRAIAGAAATPVAGEPPTHDGMLEAAKRNLSREFAAVCVTERFDDGVALLGREFGWRRIYYLPRNVSAGRPRTVDVSEEAVGLIRQRSRADIALHRFATDLFEDRVRRIPDLGARVERLRRQNSLYQTVPLAARAVERLKRTRAART